MKTHKISLKIAGCALILSGFVWSQTKPNFIFFLVDDMGWADLGVYGSRFYETPNLDQLAQQGVRFTQAYAAGSVCSPTRSSLMTGKYPAVTKNTDWFCGNLTGALPLTPYSCQLDTAEFTLAEAMKAGGYKTLFTGKWHLGPGQTYWPENQGFDTNFGGCDLGHPPSYFSPYSNPKLSDGPTGEYLTDRLATETANWIDRNRAGPFFVYHSFYQVHNPMQPKPALLTKYQNKAATFPFPNIPEFVSIPYGLTARNLQNQPNYAAMMQAMDDAVGTILAKVNQLNLSSNTYVFFMSDNGGLSTAEGKPTANTPLKAGKGWLYEGGVREPLIVRGPGLVPAGTVTNQVVISTDIYPTILQLAGLPLRPNQHRDGMSFAPQLRQGTAMDRKAIYWHYPHYSNQLGRPGSAIRMCDYKLIENFENNSLELYNLNSDIGEATNLSANIALRPIRDLLQNRLHNWRDSIRASLPPTYIEMATPALPSIAGCTQFGASNYSACATVDNGSCVTAVAPGIFQKVKPEIRHGKNGGNLFLEWDGNLDLKLVLVDSKGREFSGVTEKTGRVRFESKKMHPGIYWLRIFSPIQAWTEKIVWVNSD